MLENRSFLLKSTLPSLLVVLQMCDGVNGTVQRFNAKIVQQMDIDERVPVVSYPQGPVVLVFSLLSSLPWE